ncbi:MAG: thioredoxin family protein [Acidobacteriota bacterium]|nr:thioredoxin family protein [Acidobacteriota bacterium]
MFFRVTSFLSFASLILLLAVFPAFAQKRRPGISGKYVPVTAYDPKRDAARDIVNAIKEARRTNRNILLEVGGEWCSWCHRLDKFFVDNPELRRLRDKNFVTLKINYSDENGNEEVLSKYPAINGYPHIFFLGSEGKLLLSQDTGALEHGKSYNLEKLTTVLAQWGPKRSN